MSTASVKSNLSMLDVFGHIIIWLVVCVLTLGIGLLFWPYSAVKLVLNSMVLESKDGTGRVRCELSLGSSIGHLILWAILIVCTFGIAYPFYIFGVARTAIDKATVQY